MSGTYWETFSLLPIKFFMRVDGESPESYVTPKQKSEVIRCNCYLDFSTDNLNTRLKRIVVRSMLWFVQATVVCSVSVIGMGLHWRLVWVSGGIARISARYIIDSTGGIDQSVVVTTCKRSDMCQICSQEYRNVFFFARKQPDLSLPNLAQRTPT